MNILYIHTHDTGRFIQPYGHAVPTPNLMELAQGGVLFRNCYSCAPTCSPSRAALLTGTSPHTAGMMGLTHRGFALQNPQQHLATFLRENGYQTILCGEQHVIPYGQEKELGYTTILQGQPVEQHLDSAQRTMAQDLSNAHAVSDFLSQPHQQPFFLSFGMVSVHRPFPEPDEDINPAYLQPPPSLPDTQAARADMAGYTTMARHADHCIGVVLDALAEHNLRDNTLVIYTTDHGIAFPWMKCSLFDHGLGVSLILRFPEDRFAGQVVDSLVSHLDIYPTICELTHTRPPDWLEGHSVLPLLSGHTSEIRNEIFGEVTYHAAYEPMRCIRTERYKYIRYFDTFEGVIKPNIDNSDSKEFLLAHGLRDHDHHPPEMLHDLYFDPHERNNLADREQYAQIKADLAARLSSWMEQTQDPLRLGPVPLPPGGFTDSQDDLQPT